MYRTSHLLLILCVDMWTKSRQGVEVPQFSYIYTLLVIRMLYDVIVIYPHLWTSGSDLGSETQLQGLSSCDTAGVLEPELALVRLHKVHLNPCTPS